MTLGLSEEALHKVLIGGIDPDSHYRETFQQALGAGYADKDFSAI